MLRLKLMRLQKGWNQTTLAFHARVTPAELSRIETGRLRPHPRQLERIGRVLDLASAALLDEVEVADTEMARLVDAIRSKRLREPVSRQPSTAGDGTGAHDA